MHFLQNRLSKPKLLTLSFICRWMWWKRIGRGWSGQRGGRDHRLSGGRRRRASAARRTDRGGGGPRRRCALGHCDDDRGGRSRWHAAATGRWGRRTGAAAHHQRDAPLARQQDLSGARGQPAAGEGSARDRAAHEERHRAQWVLFCFPSIPSRHTRLMTSHPHERRF